MKKKAALQASVKLRHHQEEFEKKYEQMGGRQIAFHGLGSGKTITSINAVDKSDSKRALILTPAALQKNYKDSVDKYLTPNSRKKFTIMSYEKFRRNPDEFISKINPDTIVVDEFHRDKDPKGVSYNALKRARPHVKHFMGLTGTVTQNTPAEVFPLVNLTAGVDSHIPTKKEFEQRYTEKERVYPKGFGGLVARLRHRYGEKPVLKNEKELQSKLAPFIHKNTPDAEFLKNFPKREEVDISTPMTKEQDKMYKYFTVIIILL